MTDEKIHEALDRCWFLLQETPPPPPDTIGHDQAEHVLLMIPQAKTFVSTGRREKAMRWLGFIQGYLWTDCYANLDDLKEWNRADDASTS
jgi:hypothetical protein